MIKKEIKKQKICPSSKTNRISNPLQNKPSIKNSKKNDQHNTSNKTIKKKSRPRSISSAKKKEPNKEQITKNYSFNNTLELDYLNFTQIDLFKLDQDDIFIPYYNKKYGNDKKNIISNRYEDSTSTLNVNDCSNLKNNNNFDGDIIVNIKTKEDHLINTPSTICNYYEISSNKKKSSNKKNENNNLNDKIIDSNIKKNLSEYYENDSNNKKEQIKNNNDIDIDNLKQDKNNKNKNNTLNKQNFLLTKKGQVIPLMNEIPFSNNLMKNIYSNFHNNNKLKYLSDEEKKNNVINNNLSENKGKINVKKMNKNSNEAKTKTIDYNNNQLNELNDRINVKIINDKSKIRKMSQQKPANLYYNQFKFDTFFVTPRNINKVKNDKNLSSTKSTKINTHSMAKAKSFSSNKTNNNNKATHNNNNNNNNNVNNIIYFNKYKNNNNNNNNKGHTNANYITIKEIMDDKKRMNHNNKKKSNRTTPKNKTSNNINDKKINPNYFIKVNLKNNTKSSSNLNTIKKRQSSKENPIFNALSSNKINNANNNNNNSKNININNKIKSEIKNSVSTIHKIYKTINKNEIKSPNKDDINNNNNNLFKISKTLTEHNIIYKNQETPKNYKIQKFDSIPFTTIVKKIFIGSSKKDNLVNFDSSWKKKEKTKTEQMKCIFKPKTQSDFKPYNDIFKKGGNNNGINNEYGNDKHVKQKLLDRMNKATNNWHYIFKGNKNRKISNDGLSNLKSQNKDNFNYFYKNENIISDGSEKEDEEK